MPCQAGFCLHGVMRVTSAERKVGYSAIGVFFAAAPKRFSVVRHLPAPYGSNVPWDAAAYCEKMAASTVCVPVRVKGAPDVP